MLNILNLKKNRKSRHNSISKIEYKGNEMYQIRHHPPANKEWFNSIYVYNKNTSKLLPTSDIVTLKLVKSYFNLYSSKLENKTKLRRLRLRHRRISSNRILVSKAEFKHTNHKVIISIYLYNRQKIYYLNKVKKINTVFNSLNFFKKDNNVENNLSNLEFSINIIKNVKKKIQNIIVKVLKEKKIFFKTLTVDKNIIKTYEKKYLNLFIAKSLSKEVLRLHYEQIIFLNKSKYDNTYLVPFTNLIKSVYKKNVEFNLVNLKYLHLNSYIFIETIVKKLKNRNNRLLKVLKASLFKFKLPAENKLAIFNDIYNRKKVKQNLSLDSFLKKENYFKPNSNKDVLQEIIQKVFINNFVSFLQKKKVKNDTWSKEILVNSLNKKVHTEEITKTILNSIKYKFVNGLRIEAAGRLTRRYTAERSVLKVRYKGNIRNMDSSFKGLSTVLLRGHAKSNVQYTKLNSKLRIGSFGIKGWVSSN